MSETKPKFRIWMGDNWPGPYVVTFDNKRGRSHTVVVNGVTDITDALAVADAEFPRDEDDLRSVSITTARVAEASHHIPLLAERREEREKQEREAAAASVPDSLLVRVRRSLKFPGRSVSHSR